MVVRVLCSKLEALGPVHISAGTKIKEEGGAGNPLYSLCNYCVCMYLQYINIILS